MSARDREKSLPNVLLLTLVFPPDSVSTAQLMGELAADLARSGHAITVITTVPHYNPQVAGAQTQPLRRHWGRVVQFSDYAGIPVFHTWMPRKGGSVLGRLAAWCLFHVASTIVALTQRSRPDVLLVPSPPLTIGLSAWIVCLFRRAKYVYNVQEIYPDIAVKLGALHNRHLIRLLERLERFVYDRAAAVTVIAPRMRDRLVEKGVPPAKVHVIPNFVDLNDMRPVPRINSFAEQHGLTDKFVVSYAGNLGPAQGLETVIDAAALLTDMADVHVLLVGSGTSERALRDRVTQLGLRNCSLLSQQPYSLVPEIYSASDVCLVAQASAIGRDAIPSKVYRIMACARPIIACADAEGDLGQLITEAGVGTVVPPGSAEALANAVRVAASDRAGWQAMGVSARDFVAHTYSRHTVTNQYGALIEQLAPLHHTPTSRG